MKYSYLAGVRVAYFSILNIDKHVEREREMKMKVEVEVGVEGACPAACLR